MAQVTDYTVSNQTFPNTRADINNIFAAIATNNSGTSAPSNQQAGQWWIDTTSTTWVLYIHDGTDDIQFATIDTSANTVNFIDSALDVVTDTTPQLGGDLDLNSNDITGTGNINITGTATVTGLTTTGDINFGDNDKANFGAGNDLQIYHDSTDSYVQDAGIGRLILKTNGTRIQLNGGDDEMIRAVKDGTVKLFYDNAEKFETTSSGVTINGGTNTNVFFQTTGSGTSGTDGMVVGNVGGDSSSYQFYNYESGYMRFATSGSEAMRIDSSGNVVIGTGTAQLSSAGRGNITLNGSSSAIINMSVGDVNKAQFYHGGTDMFIGNQANGYLMFQTNATERMRINASGTTQFSVPNTDKFTSLLINPTLITGQTACKVAHVTKSIAISHTSGSATNTDFLIVDSDDEGWCTAYVMYNFYHTSGSSVNYYSANWSVGGLSTTPGAWSNTYSALLDEHFGSGGSHTASAVDSSGTLAFRHTIVSGGSTCAGVGTMHAFFLYSTTNG